MSSEPKGPFHTLEGTLNYFGFSTERELVTRILLFLYSDYRVPNTDKVLHPAWVQVKGYIVEYDPERNPEQHPTLFRVVHTDSETSEVQEVWMHRGWFHKYDWIDEPCYDLLDWVGLTATYNNYHM